MRNEARIGYIIAGLRRLEMDGRVCMLMLLLSVCAGDVRRRKGEQRWIALWRKGKLCLGFVAGDRERHRFGFYVGVVQLVVITAYLGHALVDQPDGKLETQLPK